MISDIRAAEICSALYGNTTATSVAFAHIDPGLDDGIFWGLCQEDGFDVLTLRGSVTPEDWFDDVKALPYNSRRMGRVHKGFYLGMDNAWTDMKALLRPEAQIVVTGHSLGAARSAILTGLMVCDGLIPAARISFGEPKPAFNELALIIASVPQRSYRNGLLEAHDIVTDLPFSIPRLGLDYVHPSPLILLDAQPDPNDGSGMFVYHHIDLYVRSLAQREKTGGPQ